MRLLIYNRIMYGYTSMQATPAGLAGPQISVPQLNSSRKFSKEREVALLSAV